MKKILVLFGTRPEAIKLAPLIKKLKSNKNFNVKVCVTGQHREMLDQVLQIFDIKADYDLDIMSRSKGLHKITSIILEELENVFLNFNPDLAITHGDTTTTMAASIAAFYNKIKIAHVEAGLRTKDLYSPWPEEANRKITGVLANFHFAPTISAKDNLISEGIDESSISVTGNTVIDALYLARSILNEEKEYLSMLKKKYAYLDHNKMILVTGHRRESFGYGFEKICNSLKQIATKNKSVNIVYPVHLNPNVMEPVRRILSNLPNVFLIEPVEYLEFIYLMERSYLILTDSGGIQEEAPSMGKPVLLMRNHTERPEAVIAGTSLLVGTNIDSIVETTQSLLDDSKRYEEISYLHNPFGDGTASDKIIDFIEERLHES